METIFLNSHLKTSFSNTGVLKIKSKVSKGLIIDKTQQRKQSVNLKTDQQELFKLKHKEKKKSKTILKIQDVWDYIIWYHA